MAAKKTTRSAARTPSYRAKAPLTARMGASIFASRRWLRFAKPLLLLTLGPALWLLLTLTLKWSPLPTFRNLFLLMAVWGSTAFALVRFIFPRAALTPFLMFGALAALGALSTGLLQSPYFARVQRLNLEPFVPTEADWSRTSFYYAMGSIPTRFEGAPVFYGLPYAKGPPEKFPEEIIARWKMPKIRLIIEGPKTPASKVPPRRFRDCMASGFSPSCFSLKEDLIRRHVVEVKERFAPDAWTLQWFEIKHPALSTLDTPKGLYLRAQKGSGERAAIEERYVLLTALGAHQSFILERDASSDGERASELVRQMVRALRITDSLAPGKRQVAESLAQTELTQLMKLEDPVAFVSKLSALQLTLLSKFSVDPKDIFALYHLGGTAVLFLRKVIKNRNQPEWMKLLTSLDEWSAAQKALIRSASLYAQDVAPESKQATQLRVLWMEAQKL